MIYGPIIIALAMAGKLFIDVRLYLRGGKNRHSLGPGIVLIAIAAATWIEGIKSLPLWLFGWWAVFDSVYPILIGFSPLYIGKTAFLDRLQRRFPVVQWLKYILFITSIIYYYA